MIIPLTQDMVAIIDAGDWRWLSSWSWFAQKSSRNWYAARSEKIDGKWRMVLMHREILGLAFGDGIQGEHINRDGLDNRRANLRKATHAENGRNHRRYRNNTSGYMGVCWDKRQSRWNAQIKVDGKKKNLGYFDDPIKAARAYDEAATKYHGEFATLNEPGQEYRK